MPYLAIIYYSRTGTTEKVVQYLERKLVEKGFNIGVFNIKPIREYGKPLYINPRLVFDVLFNMKTDYTLSRELVPEKYDLMIIASPIWIGKITPPIKSFVVDYKDKIRKPVICITVSAIASRKYVEKFIDLLRESGYNVVQGFSISMKHIEQLEELDKVLNKIVELIIKILGYSK